MIIGDGEARRKSHTMVDLESIENWQPSSNDKQLIPPDILPYLLPHRLVQLRKNPNAIAISVIENTKTNTQFFVVEQSNVPVSDIHAFHRYRHDMNEYYKKDLRSGMHSLPEKPTYVDVFHADYMEEVEAGFLPLTSRGLLAVHLSQVAPDHLYVGGYNDRSELRRKGIATEFYARLNRVAERLGYKYISGSNNDPSFFIHKLGRDPLSKLEPALVKKIKYDVSGVVFDSFDTITVQRIKNKKRY